jgi:hypothetical protein
MAVNRQDITRATLEEVTTQTALPLLGYSVMWRTNRVRIHRDDLLAALTVAQLDAFCPPAPSKKTTLGRAVDAWMIARLGSMNRRREMAGEIGITTRPEITLVTKSSSDWHVFYINNKAVAWASLDLTLSTDLRVCLHKKTSEMFVTRVVTGAPDPATKDYLLTDQVQVFADRFEGVLLTDDLSDMLVSLVRSCQAVAIRDTGGVYFVPAQQRDRLLHIRRTIESLSNSSAYMVLLGIPDAEEATGGLVQAVQQGLVEELEACEKRLAYTKRADTQKVKPATVTERLNDYQALRDKAQAMATLLGFQQRDLIQGIDRLNAQALALLTGGK